MQASSFAAVIGLSFATAKIESVFDQLEMRDLPLPTEGVLALSRFVRWPVGLGLLILALAVLVGMAQKGVLDRVLKPLVLANAVFFVFGGAFWVLSVFVPLLRIRPAFRK